MQKITWGIIGCGDVTEIKSGPAFNKVDASSLVAVMRRDAAKAADYAWRHQVPSYYTDAATLIADPQVNAIYVATPPDSHETYAIAAMEAGKPVYVEKPMSLNGPSAKRMLDAAGLNNVKLVVAHYRRAQPLFLKVKELLAQDAIGKIIYAKLDYRRKAATPAEITGSKTAWRYDPAKSGGGLFHDLAPHQLDLMYFLFGDAKSYSGLSSNRLGLYNADDLVTGNILFKSGVQFSGTWCFGAAAEQEADVCEIFGTNGSISFAVFNQQKILLSTKAGQQVFHFPPLQHVQQPMIEKVVQYFLGKAPNPCSAGEGHVVMKIMDAFTGR